MNRLLFAIALAAALGLPSFAANAQAHETPGAMGRMMHQDPEMKQRMATPHHMLMMAYHDNLMSFSHKLLKVARQGETVPREFARTAVSEMRRSIEELEKHRAEAMRNVSLDIKEHGEMNKMMDQHLISIKTHLRELEELAKNDRVASQEVIKHVNAMLQECQGMGCGVMDRTWMHGCPGCQCPQMTEHHKMMGDMMRKMKAQDAELTGQVAAMKQADPSAKLALLSDIVEQLVRQRAEMTVEMEKMMSREDDTNDLHHDLQLQ